MEAIFDNKANVLNAKLHTTHDSSVIYTISTDQTLFGRTYTYVKDTNPALGGGSTIVGVINWEKKTFEIQGHRRPVNDIRRKATGFRNKSRFWKWSEGREEYDIVHQEEGWEAKCTSTGEVEATLAVPYRPQLFGKTTPIVLSLSRVALAKDEVFLLLTFIYCEMKRQEKTNSSGGW
ncbi:hypothetical protein HYPSUDRAFT_33249 [Hypholoma sublateritium FD-334 SS-4]|uniref:DUF6593 domain-containing protein n=1 Tax=Hypholoma sublateritium (strain FD-334 SS-4) TaxID=945553 RepID=A0A0D2MXP5_HYPSF|nr:hypothetical protein HYPSUDRAFT_33249 [Hypholoma sublateritium FD-334 SS-4]